MPDYEVKAPVTATQVRLFVEAERARFKRDLADIRTLVETAMKPLKIYKLYGRGDKQDGEEIKQPRKIRLKFNKYIFEKKRSNGSLWSVPDIIGFTIVVQYPSDISDVSLILDNLIASRRLVTASSESGPKRAKSKTELLESSQRPEVTISTRFGRPIMSGGYFACHYNVRKPGVGSSRPICEIQIKTVLHDAWGGKSHDLTYKPSGRTSQELVDSFNLLGDALAKIDQQSDLIRRSIERTASVRERKKRAVQTALIGDVARAVVSSNVELKALAIKIEGVDIGDYSDSDVDRWTNRLITAFNEDERSACILLCLLANRSQRSGTLEQAQESIEVWFERTTEPLRRAYVKSVAALTSYSGDHTAEAIESAEQALDLIEKIDVGALDDGQRTRLDRLSNSLLTSLAYYHADRIGSHEGTIGGSAALAKEYLDRSFPIRARLGMLPKGLESSDDEITLALSDPEYGWPCFSTLDNEAFVRIQTAETETELRKVRERLDFLHKKGPSQLSGTTQLLFDYHDYCARARLNELESI